MKNKLYCIGFMIWLIAAGFCPQVMAEAAAKDNFSISGFAGYYNTSSSTLLDSDAHFETEPAYGLAATYHFTPKFSAELSGTTYSSIMDLSYDGKTGQLGKIDQNAIFYTVRFQFPIRKSNSHIYLGVGAGYFDNEFTHYTRSVPANFFGVNLKDASVDDSVGYLANAGVEMRLSRHFALYTDLKAVFNQVAFNIIYEDGTTDEKDVGMNASIFVVGGKYYF